MLLNFCFFTLLFTLNLQHLMVISLIFHSFCLRTPFWVLLHHPPSLTSVWAGTERTWGFPWDAWHKCRVVILWWFGQGIQITFLLIRHVLLTFLFHFLETQGPLSLMGKKICLLSPWLQSIDLSICRWGHVEN